MEYAIIDENYRLLGEAIIELAVFEYEKNYWKKMHLDDPKYRLSWEKAHTKTCPDNHRRETEWKIHCEIVAKEVASLEEFFRIEMIHYVDVNPEWFIEKLRRKIESNERGFYEISR